MSLEMLLKEKLHNAGLGVLVSQDLQQTDFFHWGASWGEDVVCKESFAARVAVPVIQALRRLRQEDHEF